MLAAKAFPSQKTFAPPSTPQVNGQVTSHHSDICSSIAPTSLRALTDRRADCAILCPLSRFLHGIRSVLQ